MEITCFLLQNSPFLFSFLLLEAMWGSGKSRDFEARLTTDLLAVLF